MSIIEIEAVIATLESNKAIGLDDIPNKLFKLNSYEYRDSLKQI